MLHNYLVISLRTLVKNRVYALINVFGLGMAIAIAIVAWFNYSFDAGFNKNHLNYDNVYRVTSYRDMQGREQEYGIVPSPLGLEIRNEVPGIEKSARVYRSYSPVKEGLNISNRSISYVDPEFFEIMTVPLISGNYESFTDLNNILINEELAGILFGSSDPLGKPVTVITDQSEERTFTVTGVFETPPDNSSLRFDLIIHVDNYMSMFRQSSTDWKAWAPILFVKVNPNSPPERIEASLSRFIPIQNSAREDFIINRFRLVPLSEVGDNSREIWSNSLYPAMHPAATTAPPIMAILILLIACFNFANTTIAATGRRLKEIGLRKTFGGIKLQLVSQFFLETIVICFFATLLGIAIASLLVPGYSSLWPDITLILTFKGQFGFLIFLVSIILLTGFISGIYPALYISSLKPVEILRSQVKYGRTGITSKILLGAQFTISVSSLVMGIVFLSNAKYQETFDLGYDKDNIIVVFTGADNFTRFYESVKDHADIISVAGTQQHIGSGIYRRPVKYAGRQLEVSVLDIGPEYASAMGLRLIEGRLFDNERARADRAGSIIVNEKMVKAFGWDEPVGKNITLYDTTLLTVIGVVDDFYYDGFWNELDPTILRLARDEVYYNMAVRTSPEKVDEVIEYLRNSWSDLFPSQVFEGHSQDEVMTEARDVNWSITKVNIFLAVVATLLSLIGIYSLISLAVMHRTREIGIRNVLGSSVPGMIWLLSRQFALILGVSSLLGCAGGYYLSEILLDSIWDYYQDITPGIMILSVMVIFMAAFFTTIGKTYRAATRNPVEAIKSE